MKIILVLLSFLIPGSLDEMAPGVNVLPVYCGKAMKIRPVSTTSYFWHVGAQSKTLVKSGKVSLGYKHALFTLECRLLAPDIVCVRLFGSNLFVAVFEKREIYMQALKNDSAISNCQQFQLKFDPEDNSVELESVMHPGHYIGRYAYTLVLSNSTRLARSFVVTFQDEIDPKNAAFTLKIWDIDSKLNLTEINKVICHENYTILKLNDNPPLLSNSAYDLEPGKLFVSQGYFRPFYNGWFSVMAECDPKEAFSLLEIRIEQNDRTIETFSSSNRSDMFYLSGGTTVAFYYAEIRLILNVKSKIFLRLDELNKDDWNWSHINYVEFRRIDSDREVHRWTSIPGFDTIWDELNYSPLHLISDMLFTEQMILNFGHYPNHVYTGFSLGMWIEQEKVDYLVISTDFFTISITEQTRVFSAVIYLDDKNDMSLDHEVESTELFVHFILTWSKYHGLILYEDGDSIANSTTINYHASGTNRSIDCLLAVDMSIDAVHELVIWQNEISAKQAWDEYHVSCRVYPGTCRWLYENVDFATDKWRISWSQTTTSLFTGTRVNDFFFYLEASSMVEGSKAVLLSPQLPSHFKCLTFNYVMYGDHGMGRLRVVDQTTGVVLWQLSGNQEEITWEARVELAPHVTQISIEGIRGSSHRSDIIVWGFHFITEDYSTLPRIARPPHVPEINHVPFFFTPMDDKRIPNCDLARNDDHTEIVNGVLQQAIYINSTRVVQISLSNGEVSYRTYSFLVKILIGGFLIRISGPYHLRLNFTDKLILEIDDHKNTKTLTYTFRNISQDVFYHIVIQYNIQNVSANVFINGKHYQATSVIHRRESGSPGTVELLELFSDSVFDELVIWDTLLKEDEITALYKKYACQRPHPDIFPDFVDSENCTCDPRLANYIDHNCSNDMVNIHSNAQYYWSMDIPPTNTTNCSIVNGVASKALLVEDDEIHIVINSTKLLSFTLTMWVKVLNNYNVFSYFSETGYFTVNYDDQSRELLVNIAHKAESRCYLFNDIIPDIFYHFVFVCSFEYLHVSFLVNSITLFAQSIGNCSTTHLFTNHTIMILYQNNTFDELATWDYLLDIEEIANLYKRYGQSKALDGTYYDQPLLYSFHGEWTTNNNHEKLIESFERLVNLEFARKSLILQDLIVPTIRMGSVATLQIFLRKMNFFQMKTFTKMMRRSSTLGRWFNILNFTSNYVNTNEIPRKITATTTCYQATITWSYTQQDKLSPFQGFVVFFTSIRNSKQPRIVNTVLPKIIIADLVPGTTYYYNISPRYLIGIGLMTSMKNFTTKPQDANYSNCGTHSPTAVPTNVIKTASTTITPLTTMSTTTMSTTTIMSYTATTTMSTTSITAMSTASGAMNTSKPPTTNVPTTIPSTKPTVRQITPYDVFGISTSPNIISVFWRSDQPPSGLKLRYILTYKSWRQVDVNISDLSSSITLYNLKADTEYAFKVCAIASLSQCSSWHRVRTLAGVANVCPSNVSFDNITSKTVNISWMPLDSRYVPGNLSSYVLTYWTQQVGFSKDVYQIDTNSTQTFINLKQLEENVKYNIRISASLVRLTMLNFTAECSLYSFTTLEDVPDSAPLGITQALVTSTSFTVRWKKIRVPQLNGVLLGYRLNYTMQHLKDHKLRKRREDNESKKKTISVLIDPDKTSYVLFNLAKFATYSVSIAARTVKGYGPYSTIIEMSTDEDVPSKPPQNIQLESLTSSTSLKIKWQPVPDGYVHGVLIGYVIRYYVIEKGESRIDTTQYTDINVPADTNVYEMKQLSSFTKYKVFVLAKTRIGYGPFSKAVIGATCRCHSRIKTNWWAIEPYTSIDQRTQLNGIFPVILKRMVISCCQKCQTHQTPTLDFYSKTNGVFDNGYYHKRSLQDVKSNISDNSDLSFPIYGSSDQNSYSATYGYVQLVSSPGEALVVNRQPLQSASEVLFITVAKALPMVLVFSVMSALAGIIIWSLECRKNSEQFPPSFKRGFYNGVWWAIVTSSTVGYGDRSPKTFGGKLFSVIWTLVGQILVLLCTASLTKNLTTYSLRMDHKLYGKQIAAIYQSPQYNFAIRRNARTDTVNFRVKDMIDKLRRHDVEGILIDSYVAGARKELFSEYFRIRKIFDRMSGHGIVLADDTRKLQQCFTKYVSSNREQIFAEIRNVVESIEEPDLSESVTRSTKLFDPNSKHIRTTLVVSAGLYFILFLTCALNENVLRRRKKMKVKPVQTVVLERSILKRSLKEDLKQFANKMQYLGEKLKQRHKRELLTLYRLKKTSVGIELKRVEVPQMLGATLKLENCE